MGKGIGMPEFTTPIDQMHSLSSRLGKARTDRIRYHSTVTQITGKPRKTRNRIYELMQECEPFAIGCPIDDIIQGVVRLDHHGRNKDNQPSIPLNASRIYNMFQILEELSTPEIMRLMDINERQAQKYLKAAKLIMHYVEVHQAKKELPSRQ